MILTRKVYTLHKTKAWLSLFDFFNSDSANSFIIKENKTCKILNNLFFENQTLLKIMVEDTGHTGWIIVGVYPTFEAMP